MPEESKLAEKLENSKKFSEEELKVVKEIQDEYFKIQTQFGQLGISKIRLDSQFKAWEDSNLKVHEAFEKLQTKEREFLDETTKKYGEGNLNPETGEFTPNKSE